MHHLFPNYFTRTLPHIAQNKMNTDLSLCSWYFMRFYNANNVLCKECFETTLIIDMLQCAIIPPERQEYWPPFWKIKTTHIFCYDQLYRKERGNNIILFLHVAMLSKYSKYYFNKYLEASVFPLKCNRIHHNSESCGSLNFLLLPNY